MEEPRLAPEVSLPTGEQLPAPEAPAASSPAEPTTPVASLPVNLPAPSAATVAGPVVGTTNSANPILAEDVDVIEKEWVDRAEGVIKDTTGDPYQEEEQVEDLQIDYMKKRFGKDIKKSNDS